jgi:hypothetical protein
VLRPAGMFGIGDKVGFSKWSSFNWLESKF